MIDLHIHTNQSDGENSPSELVQIAKLSNITTVAITDHDTCSGVKEAINKSYELDIKVIPGIEITAYDNEEIHILGYFVDYKSSKFDNYFELIQQCLNNEEKRIFEYFDRIGIAINRSEIVENYSKNEAIAPGHFIDWLVDNGFEKNKKEAWIKYFLDSELKDRKAGRMKIKDAIEFIKSIDGIPVLAHPDRISWDINTLDRNLRELKEYGLKGIEAIYSLSTDEQISNHIKLANKNNLLITLGSDYHGHKVKDYIDIGTGRDNSLIKYQNDEMIGEILSNLKDEKLIFL